MHSCAAKTDQQMAAFDAAKSKLILAAFLTLQSGVGGRYGEVAAGP